MQLVLVNRFKWPSAVWVSRSMTTPLLFHAKKCQKSAPQSRPRLGKVMLIFYWDGLCETLRNINVIHIIYYVLDTFYRPIRWKEMILFSYRKTIFNKYLQKINNISSETFKFHEHSLFIYHWIIFIAKIIKL